MKHNTGKYVNSCFYADTLIIQFGSVCYAYICRQIWVLLLHNIWNNNSNTLMPSYRQVSGQTWIILCHGSLDWSPESMNIRPQFQKIRLRTVSLRMLRAHSSHRAICEHIVVTQVKEYCFLLVTSFDMHKSKEVQCVNYLCLQLPYLPCILWFKNNLCN